ncbi:MAG: hypothetical protein P4L87_06570 [Formivibrio sp.]|nr:hypothetical protein [Formivibrio sp.]
MKTLSRVAFGIACLFLSVCGAQATNCPNVTYQFTNGTTADATQVNQNFQDVLTCTNGLAPTNNPSFTGNVGIGTTTPENALTVVGQIESTSSAPGMNMYDTAASANNHRWSFGAGSGSFAISLFNDAISAGTQPIQITRSGVTATSISLDAGNHTIPELYLHQNGNVGIGTTSPAVPLTVVGDVRVGTSGNNGCLQNYAGTAIAGTCSSDAALKIVTGRVDGVVEGLTHIELTKFKWNATAARLYHVSTTIENTGYLAQAVQGTFPELVSIDKNGYRQINYTTLSLYGLQAIKELKALNDKQASEIAALKKRIDAEDQRLSRLEASLNVRTAAN